jgi:maltose alpha-D-glucosyltransferase/alpha-amylase
MVDRAALVDDGTEGHWLLRELRDFVAVRRPEAVLMGEVDVPPEEYAGFFGDGDRLHLLLDFWLNNNLFLSLATGDARHLAGALQRQPRPPGRAAYANFVRNHDELDLEQLTDEDRRRVLDAFAPEEHMRAYGRGIRRRVAPMLGGEDDRLAVVHAVLLALPGPPVLLYGDEIGIGDDVGRPERLAVRVPMQWTDAPGAGFSTAPEDTWARRPVPDPDFGPQARNVYAQTLSRDSLLARMGNLVRTRIGLHEVGSGEPTVLDVDCPPVFALRYDLEGAAVVMLANLSRDGVEIDLPVEDLEDLVDLLADGDYPALAKDETKVELRGYGYRWLRPRKDMFG